MFKKQGKAIGSLRGKLNHNHVIASIPKQKAAAFLSSAGSLSGEAHTMHFSWAFLCTMAALFHRLSWLFSHWHECIGSLHLWRMHRNEIQCTHVCEAFDRAPHTTRDALMRWRNFSIPTKRKFYYSGELVPHGYQFKPLIIFQAKTL